MESSSDEEIVHVNNIRHLVFPGQLGDRFTGGTEMTEIRWNRFRVLCGFAHMVTGPQVVSDHGAI